MKRSIKRTSKNLPAPRRTSPSYIREQRGIFAKISFNLKRWRKKLKNYEAAPKTQSPQAQITPGLLSPDLLDELKIAQPKPGRTIPSRPRITLPYLIKQHSLNKPQPETLDYNSDLAKVTEPQTSLHSPPQPESADLGVTNPNYRQRADDDINNALHNNRCKPRTGYDTGDSLYNFHQRADDDINDAFHNYLKRQGLSDEFKIGPSEATNISSPVYNPAQEADHDFRAAVYNPAQGEEGNFGAEAYNPAQGADDNFGVATHNPAQGANDDFGVVAQNPAPRGHDDFGAAIYNPAQGESEIKAPRRRKRRPQSPDSSTTSTKYLNSDNVESPQTNENNRVANPSLKSKPLDDAPRRRRRPPTYPKKNSSLESTLAEHTPASSNRLRPAKDSTRVHMVKSAPERPFSSAPQVKTGRKPSSFLRKPILIAAGIGLAIIAAVTVGIYKFSESPLVTAKVPRIPLSSLPQLMISLSPGLYELQALARENSTTKEVTVVSGSSLSEALESVGIGVAQNSPAIIARLGAEDALGGVVRPGDKVRAIWTNKDEIKIDSLEYYRATGGAPLVIRPTVTNEMWLYDLSSQPLTINAARETTVESSLWAAGSKVGLDANIIMSLTDILASEIDFLTDIKSGDTLQILYSRDYRDGQPVGSPTINMVKMVNQGRDYELYRYINSKGSIGYFDPKGRSNLKTFFLSPLQYKRISSKFSMTRMHPILKKVRPHQGVDYAAPSGTPVSAIADGVVAFCGWAGGFGRLVTIKHNNTYTTMNAHLSRFAPGLKKGSVVKQGDLIGNVGSSGLSTGPHLDFRLKKNGVFIDPVPELAKQKGKLLEAAEAQAFTQVVTSYRNQMTYQLGNNS